MNSDDAELVVEELNGRIARRDGWDATAFELQRVWISGDGDDCVVNVVYRQRGAAWTGFRKRDLSPWVYQDHLLTPTEVAIDIYDFVLVEPTRTPNHIPPDENGVHWWPEYERPIEMSE